MEKKTLSDQAKLLKINTIVLLVGGLAYGVVYFLGSQITLGIAIVVATFLLAGGIKAAQRFLSEKTVVYIIAFVQFFLIVGFGILGGEFDGGFALIISVVAFNAIYFDKQIVLIQWVLIDIILGVSFSFIELFYGNIEISFLVRSALGINFSMLFLYLLVISILKFKAEVVDKEKTSEQLLIQIDQKMQEQTSGALKIKAVFEGIKESSDSLRHTSDQMLAIASDLTENASNQTMIIRDLTEKSTEMADEIKSAQQIALDSSKSVTDNAKVLEESNESMTQAVATINEMEESSKKIIDIIAQIENIAFQTNILAVNAAIEAARAGSGGRGFAVVAEEVQTLAAKSSEAATASSVLVGKSIENVQTGAQFIKAAAQRMDAVIRDSNLTAKKVEQINAVIESQVETIDQILAQMNSFMYAINQTSQTAAQSNNMASDISEQIAHINDAMSAGE